jgi:hypothetical protein
MRVTSPFVIIISAATRSSCPHTENIVVEERRVIARSP